MSAPDSQGDDRSSSLEHQRWKEERGFREREVAVREREQQSKEAELALSQKMQAASRWRSPVVVAILAAAVAATGNAVVAYSNNSAQRSLEAQKSEQARILEVIKTGSPDKAAANLRFLLQAGLINDKSIRRQLTAFLRDRTPGSGPALPSAAAGASFVSRFEGVRLRPYRDALGQMTIGSGHVLTARELRTGKLMIAGKLVAFRSGITQQQATLLLANDLEPVRREVDRLVTVKLTTNQLDALTSFAANAGIASLRQSTLLKELNAGQYEAVPGQLMRWTRLGGRVSPGLVARRKAEAALWNKR